MVKDIDDLMYVCDFLVYLKKNHEGELADIIGKFRVTAARVETLQAEYEECLRGN